MSWNIKVAGTREEVSAVIEAEGTVPMQVKTDILQQVAKTEPPLYGSGAYRYGILVETFGHIAGNSCDYTVKVTNVIAGLVPKTP